MVLSDCDTLTCWNILRQSVAAGSVAGDRKSEEDRRSSGFSDESSLSSPSADDSFRRTVGVAQLPEVARRGRLFAKRHRRRLVLQSGVCNVSFANVDRRGARLLMDIFTTLLEMKWRCRTRGARIFIRHKSGVPDLVLARHPSVNPS